MLERLTDKALKATNFVYKPIEIIQDEQNVEESIDTVQEDDQDIEEEDLEEFVIDEEVYSDDSEDGAYMGGIKHNLNEDNG